MRKFFYSLLVALGLVSCKEKTANIPKVQKVPKRVFTEEGVKAGYKSIASFCLTDEKEVAVFHKFVDEELNWNAVNPGYMIEPVSEFLFEHAISLFLWFDWKEMIEDVQWQTIECVQKNFGITVSLPGLESYSKDGLANVEDTIFDDYRKVLHKVGLELSLMDLNSDSYMFVIHPQEYKEKVADCIKEITFIPY